MGRHSLDHPDIAAYVLPVTRVAGKGNFVRSKERQFLIIPLRMDC